MRDKVCVITGGTDGIGKAAAYGLALQGARLLVHGRDPDKGARAVAELKARSGNPAIDLLQADFSSLADVRRLAAALLERTPRIDVLINNAGGIFVKRTLSQDGHEMTFAVNHLAPFLLTSLLIDALKGAAPSRIFRLMVGKGLYLSAIGIVIGLVGSFWLTQVLASMLVEVKPTDPLTFISVAVLFLIIAFMASWLPALRAAGLDPTTALRNE